MSEPIPNDPFSQNFKPKGGAKHILTSVPLAFLMHAAAQCTCLRCQVRRGRKWDDVVAEGMAELKALCTPKPPEQPPTPPADEPN